MTNAKTLSHGKDVKIVLVGILVAFSTVTWWFSYRSGLSTIYNDSMSHLDIARSVFDSKQPGLAQIGTVWLPLNHILELLLVWSNWAWHSGFAGSFFSMVSYVLSAIGVYKIVSELTDNFLASVIGAGVFALNLNILYLQTTPLTEPLYLLFFIYSIYYLIKFINTDTLSSLLLLGAASTLQVLIRYDGWFVVVVEGLALVWQQLFIHRVRFGEMIGKLLIFATPIVTAMILWFLWNALIFGNPLYFLFGPSSAHAQQDTIQGSFGLITKHHLWISIVAYWWAISLNVGFYMILLAAFGALLFLFKYKERERSQVKIIFLLALASPIIFNVLALWLGFSIINLPQLHWDPSGDPSQQWFNVLYGIMALPLVAVMIGVCVGYLKKAWIVIAIILIIVLQTTVMYSSGIITITDGTAGTSDSLGYHDIGNFLAANVHPDQNVLISTALYNSVIFRSGLPIRNFITEGDSHYWTGALAQPEDYAEWVIMGNQNRIDIVYDTLMMNNPNRFLRNYKQAYCDKIMCAYKRRSANDLFVEARGGQLSLGEENYSVKGVNVYDLAYQQPSSIDHTLNELHISGVNTIRFWLFGDGLLPSGFQPAAGIMNESRFDNADYLIADAAKYHIRLIPVLVNNWTDYGGMSQYLKWIGVNPNDHDAFYTNPRAIQLFENYLNHVLTRTNTVNGVSYTNDPTILAWEIVNEPRYSATDTPVFDAWVATISQYIRQKDPNHLITMETDTATVGTGGTVQVTDNCSTLSVDICSAHLYLDQNGSPLFSTQQQLAQLLNDYAGITTSDTKPFILGEVGVNKATKPFGENPLAALETITKRPIGSGFLIWNFSQTPDDSYGFSPDGYQGAYTLQALREVMGLWGI